MKLIDPNITILVSKDWAEIEIRDSESFCTFVKIKMTAEQFTAAIWRLGNVECEWEVYNLDKIGKKQENEYIVFEIPEKLSSKDTIELIKLCSLAMVEQGYAWWQSDNYYESQNSFFNKDWKRYARCTIRKWN